MQNTLLIVDDEPRVIAAFRRVFIDEPCEIFSANTGIEGLKHLKREKIKVVISDEKMPGMSGTEFLSVLKAQYPEVIRIILTGCPSLEVAMKAVNNGEIHRFLTKPWNEIELKFTIRSAVEKYNLESENRRLLATVRRQAVNLKLLERKYPGITKLEKDETGSLTLKEIPDEELSAIIAQCESEYN